jgi:hypothetical protein
MDRVSSRVSLAVASLAALVALAGCGPSGPLTVSTIQLGRSLNPDNSVAEHTTTFRRNDTVYVAVLTAAPGRGVVGVKWTYGGQVIDQPEKEVSYRDAAATSFNLVNSGGFPPGNYSVEVFVDGQSAGIRNFNVQ